MIARRLAFFSAICFCVFQIGTANATAIDVSGGNPAGATLTGTIYADSLFSNVSAVDLTVSSSLWLDGVYTIVDSYGASQLNVSNPALGFFTIFNESLSQLTQTLQMNYDSEVATATVNFDISACLGDTSCIDFVTLELANAIQAAADEQSYYSNFYFAISAVTPVPEPATLPLFASGLVGIGLLALRKRKKTA